MWTVVLNAAVSLVIGIVGSLIAAFIFDWIKGKQWLRILGLVVVVTAGLFLLLNFVVNPSVDIRVTTIDGQSPSAASESSAIGYRVDVRGYLARSSGPVYVVVKPLNDNFWYIQPPAPATFMGSGTIDWAGQAYLGTPGAGEGEQFVVFAVATSAKHIAEEKLDREPSGVKSNAVLLRRSH